MDLQAAESLGYDLTPAAVQAFGFHAATRVASLVFTSGQTPRSTASEIRGKVGLDVDIATAQKAAEICAVNCLKAALAVAEQSEIERVVKLMGMVNVAPNFNDTSTVIDGATDLLNSVFPGQPSHARTAVGMVLPGNWAVEIDLVIVLR